MLHEACALTPCWITHGYTTLTAVFGLELLAQGTFASRILSSIHQLPMIHRGRLPGSDGTLGSNSIGVVDQLQGKFLLPRFARHGEGSILSLLGGHECIVSIAFHDANEHLDHSLSPQLHLDRIHDTLGTKGHLVKGVARREVVAINREDIRLLQGVVVHYIAAFLVPCIMPLPLCTLKRCATSCCEQQWLLVHVLARK